MLIEPVRVKPKSFICNHFLPLLKENAPSKRARFHTHIWELVTRRLVFPPIQRSLLILAHLLQALLLQAHHQARRHRHLVCA